MVVLRKSAVVLGYKLEPWEPGLGNDEAPAVAWVGWWLLWPIGWNVARAQESLGWMGRRNSAATGRSHAGPLVLHLVTLAPSSPAPTAGLEHWLETAGCS